MKQTIILFISGIVLALLAIGGYFVTQTYFTSANEELVPNDIQIDRTSPTSAVVSFTTEEPAIASIECATSPTDTFSLCGAETQETQNHEIRTSIILDPDSEYYFFIKIRNVTYDNLGEPFVITVTDESANREFPTDLLGACRGDSEYDPEFDVNNDGCIRANDRMIYLQQ